MDTGLSSDVLINNHALTNLGLYAQVAPRGHPECLKGKTFVITGTLDSLYRHECEDLVKRHSGRVTGNVSSKTTFLVCGANAGNSKITKV